MPITADAGDAFAHKFAKQFAAGFAGNNHAVTMEGLLAPKLSWDWSDATVGEGAPADIMDIFSKSWGMMVDNFVLIDPTVVVDTTNSKVVIAGSLIINITGGVAGETNLVKSALAASFIIFALFALASRATSTSRRWRHVSPHRRDAPRSCFVITTTRLDKKV